MFRRTSVAAFAATQVRMESWREQDISFVKYCNVATETLHKCVVPAKAAKYTKCSVVGYKAQVPKPDGGFEETVIVPAETKDY